MSRQDLGRARQLVRLRELAFDTAMRTLGAATLAMTAADAVVAAALVERDAAIAGLKATRVALVDDPADAAAGLARIGLADDRRERAGTALAEAEEQRRIAEDAVIAARAQVRRAQARRDAMTARADRLRRGIARAAEERAATEAEEGAAAMRKAA